MKQDFLQFPILIGDIGGTNARFALILDADQNEQVFLSQHVSAYPSIADCIEQAILPYVKQRPRSMILAVASAIKGEEIRLTNSHWVISPPTLLNQLKLDGILVINDFEAQALATTALEPAYIKPIGPVKGDGDGARVIMGPGTGLGVAGLVKSDDYFIPIAGEGGHVDFAPCSQRDLALMPYLEKLGGRVSAEMLLSGRGIINIYQAICQADHIKPCYSLAEQITYAALQSSNQQAMEAVEFFICYLARLAGDFALIFKAHGGVFIGGGIFPRMVDLIDEDKFRQIFEDKLPHNSLLKTMPTFIMTHPRAPLIGMAAFARHPERFLVNSQSRFWQNKTLK